MGASRGSERYYKIWAIIDMDLNMLLGILTMVQPGFMD